MKLMRLGFIKRLFIVCLAFGMFGVNTITYADESGSIESENLFINLTDLREAFINESIEFRDLKENIVDLDQSADASEKTIFYRSDSPSGIKDQRKGSYYEYAYPTFVQLENLKTQVDVLDNTKDITETTLSYSADQLLSNYSLLKKQLELYDKMVEKTEQTYAASEKKYELGSISKMDLETSQVELENLKYNRDKIQYSMENVMYNMMKLAGLEFGKEYRFQEPVFTEIEFSESNFGSYYEAALEVSKDVANANREMDALENEGKYVKLYHSSILKSDLLDFDRRYEEGKQAQETAQNEVYQSLRSYLSEFNKLSDEISVADIQIKYDKNNLAKLAQMEKMGQVVDTDRQSYEIKVFQSEIEKMSLMNEKLLLSQKIDLLVSYGIKL